MEVKKLGIDQLKFSKGSKIYSKGEKLILHIMFTQVRLIFTVPVDFYLVRLEKEKYLEKGDHRLTNQDQ